MPNTHTLAAAHPLNPLVLALTTDGEQDIPMDLTERLSSVKQARDLMPLVDEKVAEADEVEREVKRVVRPKIADPQARRLVFALLSLEEACLKLGDFEGVLRMGAKVQAIGRHVSLPLASGINALLVSDALLRKNDFKELALQATSFRESRERVTNITEAVGQRVEIVECLLNNLISSLQSKYSQGLGYLLRAKALYRKLKSTHLRSEGLLNEIDFTLAVGYFNLHRFKEAEELFGVLGQKKHHAAEGQAYVGLIKFYNAQFLDAQLVFASILAGDFGPYYSRIRLLQDQARAFIELDDLREAERCLGQSFDLLGDKRKLFDYARGLFIRANIQCREGKPDLALETLAIAIGQFSGTTPEKADFSAMPVRNNRYLLRTALLRSGILARTGHYKSALGVIDEAKKYFLPDRGSENERTRGYRIEEAQVARQRAKILALMGEVNSSRREYVEALSHLAPIDLPCAQTYGTRTFAESAFYEIHRGTDEALVRQLIDEAKRLANRFGHKREFFRALLLDCLYSLSRDPLIDPTHGPLFLPVVRCQLVENLKGTYGKKLIGKLLAGFMELTPNVAETARLVKRFRQSCDGIAQHNPDESVRAYAAELSEAAAKAVTAHMPQETPTGGPTLLEILREADFTGLKATLQSDPRVRKRVVEAARYYEKRLTQYST